MGNVETTGSPFSTGSWRSAKTRGLTFACRVAEDVEVTARRLERLLRIIINLFGEVWEIMSLRCRGCRCFFKNTLSDTLPGFKLDLNIFHLFLSCFFFVYILKLFIGLAGLYGAGYWTAGRRDEFVLSAGRGRTQLTTNVF